MKPTPSMVGRLVIVQKVRPIGCFLLQQAPGVAESAILDNKNPTENALFNLVKPYNPYWHTDSRLSSRAIGQPRQKNYQNVISVNFSVASQTDRLLSVALLSRLQA